MKRIKILCPVDFSKTSENALKYAFEIACRDGSELILTHVIAPAVTLDVGFSDDKEFFNMSEEIKDRLEKECARLGLKNHYKKVKPSFFIKVGLLTEELSKSIKEKSIDLVIIGTRTSHSIDQKILGTNSTEVFKHTDCPVLIVPENFRYSPFKNIVYATDGKGDDDYAISYTLKLAADFNARIHFVNVQIGEAEGEEQIVSPNIYRLLETNKDVKVFFHFLERMNIKDGINDLGKRKKAELIVLVTRDRNFFEKLTSKSVTKTLAVNPQRPILVMHK